MNAQPKIALLGIGYDEGSSFRRGAAEAPSLIRAALHSESSNLWSENGLDLGARDALFDAGDVVPISGLEMLDRIEGAIDSLLERGFKPIALGGDHSITYPIVKSFSKRFDNLTVLQFDAHPDLYDEFEGNRYSHACPFSRIMESALAKRLVQVGIRTANDHQREQAKRFGVEMIEMRDWQDALRLECDAPVYLSLDVDVLDPAFAPGVSHYEPGGLSTRQVIEVIQAIKAPILGADIVEYNPQADWHNLTAMVCAKFIKEIGSKMREQA